MPSKAGHPCFILACAGSFGALFYDLYRELGAEAPTVECIWSVIDTAASTLDRAVRILICPSLALTEVLVHQQSKIGSSERSSGGGRSTELSLNW